MRTIVLAVATMAVVSPAFADRPVTAREHSEISRAIGAHGCKGGRYEFDRDDHRYEVDDARCSDGREYDFELDPWFRITKKERD